MANEQKQQPQGASAARKKMKRSAPNGRAYVNAGFGNTVVTITDGAGNVVCWATAGMLGFKGSRKGTPFAAQMAAQEASKKAVDSGMKSVDVFLKGPGAGREPAVRALAASGLRVTSLRDITPVPHNGCRPPKRRRI